MTYVVPSNKSSGNLIGVNDWNNNTVGNVIDLDARTNPLQAVVATDQSTTSTSYVDLATAGPAVTLTTGTKVIVILGAQIWNATAAASGMMAFAVSGATTIAAADVGAVMFGSSTANIQMFASRIYLVTVTAGSNTFTAKYRARDGGTAHFADRNIIVWPANKLA